MRYVIANWKMNLNLAEALTLGQAEAGLAADFPTVQVIVAPSLPWLVPLREAIKFHGHNWHLASQVVSQWQPGAYTGDVAAEQLKGVVDFCLVGHSERRRFHHEDGPAIQGQVKALLAAGITPVICFGEREKGQGNVAQTLLRHLDHELVDLDLEKCLLAYEPLWAIGTGKPATPNYISAVAEAVKSWRDVPLLYGGSVTADNAAELAAIKSIDGVLVGGASLHLQEFRHICARFAGQVGVQ